MSTTDERPAQDETQPRPTSTWQRILPTVWESLGAIVLALVVGALLIIFSTPRVVESLAYFFSYPWDFFRFAGVAVWDGYSALVQGSIGSLGAVERTLERAAPLISAGLGVSLAFRCGLFNIGAQGQILAASIAAGGVGFLVDLPTGVHLLVAVLAAVTAGAAWGAIPGVLKARAGAHEVITTIMLNYVARFLMLFVLAREAFQRPGSDNLLSPAPTGSARFPEIGGVHTGFLLSLLAAVALWWLLERSVLGFEMRAVGANPEAARTAGMSVGRVYVQAMSLAGLLAGLAAAMIVLGQGNSLTDNVAGTVGFDAITVALLGRATPLGTVLAGLLFGALSSGGLSMQAAAGVPPEMAQVLQSLIVLFVAAPALVRAVIRVRSIGASKDNAMQAKGWGG